MKKTASKSRPLSLKRETVRVLASSQLASAQGGGLHDIIIDRSGDNGSNCIVCRIVLPPIPRTDSAGQGGGCATEILTPTRVINP
jgi:hypothetical protein